MIFMSPRDSISRFIYTLPCLSPPRGEEGADQGVAEPLLLHANDLYVAARLDFEVHLHPTLRFRARSGRVLEGHQGPSQLEPTAIDAALHRSFRKPQVVHDLLVAQAPEVAEDDRLPELLGEARESLEKHLPLVPDLDAPVRIESTRGELLELGFVPGGHLPPPPPASIVVDAVVAAEGVEPGSEVRGAVELVERSEDPQEDFLG